MICDIILHCWTCWERRIKKNVDLTKFRSKDQQYSLFCIQKIGCKDCKTYVPFPVDIYKHDVIARVKFVNALNGWMSPPKSTSYPSIVFLFP